MKDFIEEAYGIKLVGISSYGNGQTSNVYKVIGDSNSYIFKSHFHEQIASNKFHCLEILSKINLSPSPIRSKDNKIYTEHSRKFYILMHFINIKGCDKSEINYVHLGKTIKSMHSVLSNLKLNNISERFNEELLMKDIKSVDIKQLIEKRYYEYKDYTSDSLTNIHGDLGVWNLLLDDNKISIIDFGEAGYGDPFFDLAAVTESLNLKDNEIKQLLRGYGHTDYESIVHLSYMQKKWRLRGIIYLAANELKTETEIYNLIKLENT